MNKLNPDQEKVVTYLTDWWQSGVANVVINSKGGTGKTFLVNHLLKRLKGCTPLILTPTNEALAQIREKTEGDYLFKTVYSALGITPTTSKKEIVFEQRKLPRLWEDYNLCIIDEVSMLDNTLIDVLTRIGIKIIWLGHESQLPPVEPRRRRDDNCISPVFTKGWDTLTLTIPQRNTGKLWEFNNLVEEAIYDDKIILPRDYNISGKKYRELISDSTDLFLSGRLKLALWDNVTIDSYNRSIRKTLFGVSAEKSLYIEGDNIILTAPMTIIDRLEDHSDIDLKALVTSKESLPYLYSNTKAVVKSARVAVIRLNSELTFRVIRIEAMVRNDIVSLYTFTNPMDKELVATYYERLAWKAKTEVAKGKRYRERHFILSCFADIKHSYALSSHRLQGSSVENMLVIKSNIFKNPCKIERKKCFYVATSRAMKELYIYNG